MGCKQGGWSALRFPQGRVTCKCEIYSGDRRNASQVFYFRADLFALRRQACPS